MQMQRAGCCAYQPAQQAPDYQQVQRTSDGSYHDKAQGEQQSKTDELFQSVVSGLADTQGPADILDVEDNSVTDEPVTLLDEEEGLPPDPVAGLLAHYELQVFRGGHELAAGLQGLQTLAEQLEVAMTESVEHYPHSAEDSEQPGQLSGSETDLETDELWETDSPQQADSLSQEGLYKTEGQPNNSVHVQMASKSDGAFTLAALHASGLLPPGEPVDVLRLLRLSASSGSMEAQLALSDRLLSGRGVPQRCWAGLRWARVVAEQLAAAADAAGDYQQPYEPVLLRERWRDAYYVAAEELEDGTDRVQMEADLAFKGDLDAQRQMGFRQLLGRGLDANPREALRDFAAAAAAGDEYAMFNVGYMYMRGMHVAQNYTLARLLFQEAAEHQLAAAYNGLGVLHFNGQGVPRNYSAARAAFEAGASLGDADSQYNLGRMHEGGYGVEQNHSSALEYYRVAHDAGHWRTPLSLAHMHQHGLGVPRNCSAAETYLRVFLNERAGWHDHLRSALAAYEDGQAWEAAVRYALLAEQGCDVAMANLAWLLGHDKAFKGPAHQRAALALLLRAAKLGIIESWVDAANIVLHGDRFGLPAGADAKGALELYQKAADRGDIEAIYSLGWMHQHGVGVPADAAKARELYRKAVDEAQLEHYAVAPLLALFWLNVLSRVAAVLRALELLRAGLVRDAGLLVALACVLAAVLWRIHNHRNAQSHAPAQLQPLHEG